jgi:hypothetical protein
MQEEQDLEGGTSMVNISMEIDPTKFDDATDSEVNTLQLWLTAQKIFSSFVRSEKQFPEDLRKLLRLLNEHTSEEDSHKILGEFLFYRFLCPGLVAPHTFGILQQPPHATVQRQLILLAKVLQNLASGTLPGQREQHMSKLNEFIRSNGDTLDNFLNQLIENKGPSKSFKINDSVRINALQFVWDDIEEHYDTYRQAVEDSDELTIAEELDKLFE